MEESKTISQYHGKICNITNEAFSLGKAIPDERLICKMLKSLPPCFNWHCRSQKHKNNEIGKTSWFIENIQNGIGRKQKKKGDKDGNNTSSRTNDDREDVLEIVGVLARNVNQAMKTINK